MTPTKTRRWVGHGFWAAAGIPLNVAVHRLGGDYWTFVLILLGLALLFMAHELERHFDAEDVP